MLIRLRSRLRNNHSRGFTLIEVLVTLSILGILMSLLLPAVQTARAAARRTQCQHQLHQLAIALHNYHDVHSCFPSGSLSVGPAFRQISGWGWGAMLLPHLDQRPLYEAIDFKVGTAVGANHDLIGRPLAIWTCPADPAPVHITAVLPEEADIIVSTGNYCGVEPVLEAMSSIKAGQVTDGLSQTFFVGERVNQLPIDGSLGYTSSWFGRVATERQTALQAIPHLPASRQFPINLSLDFPHCFSSHHSGGSHFAFGDASARLMSESIELDIYVGLGTPNGGEPVSF